MSLEALGLIELVSLEDQDAVEVVQLGLDLLLTHLIPDLQQQGLQLADLLEHPGLLLGVVDRGGLETLNAVYDIRHLVLDIQETGVGVGVYGDLVVHYVFGQVPVGLAHDVLQFVRTGVDQVVHALLLLGVLLQVAFYHPVVYVQADYVE